MGIAPVPSRGQGAVSELIFDDFDYRSSEVARIGALFGPNDWTDDEGKPAGRSRLWYLTNWSDYGSDPLVQVEVRTLASGRALHLDALPGHTLVWARDRMPPMVLTGFTAPYGVWAARLRFADLSDDVAMMQSFWTMSPYTVCQTSACERSQNYWSEFDHEWNNWFDRRFRPQMISTGGGINGAAEADISNYMRAVTTGNPGPLSCTLVAGDGSQSGTLAISECRERFTGGWADLMIRINEQTATFEAVVWPSYGSSPEGSHIRMQRTIELEPGHPQPMYAVFSQLLGPDRTLRRRTGFSVDWFYFTPEYKRVTSLYRVLEDVGRLRARGLVRVNTTGQSLEAPGTAEEDQWHPIEVQALQGPMLRNGRYYWTAYPAQNNGAYYHLDWSYRVQQRPNTARTSWSRFTRSGFVFSLPQASSSPPDAVEIRTRLQYVDIYGQPTGSSVDCFGFGRGFHEAYRCD